MSPYSKKIYGSRSKWKKYQRCIEKVKKKKTKVNPFSVCRKSIYEQKKTKKKKQKKRN